MNESLATLLRYPSVDFQTVTARCRAAFPELMAPFADYVATASDAELEELYTRTFDIQAICYLEVGYVLFGEDYKRGHFLVKMQELQRNCGNDCGTELSDHLTNILTLLPKLCERSPEEASNLVTKLVLPALDKMLQGFVDGGNVYAAPLRAVREILTRDFPPSAKAINCAPARDLSAPNDFGRPS